MQILTSLLSLIMTEVRSKRRAFFPIIFTSICFKKPLLIRIPEFASKYHEVTDKVLPWEMIKMEMRVATIFFSKKAKKRCKGLCWRDLIRVATNTLNIITLDLKLIGGYTVLVGKETFYLFCRQL